MPRIPESNLSNVINGIRKTARIRRLLAAELGVDVKELWPNIEEEEVQAILRR